MCCTNDLQMIENHEIYLYSNTQIRIILALLNQATNYTINFRGYPSVTIGK
jgi:hypothetical protein